MAAWLLVLNASAVPDASASVFAVPDVLGSEFAVPVPEILQEVEFKLYPELQFVQTVESLTEHTWQFSTMHLLTVRLIIFWTGPDNPEIVEVM